MMDMEGLDSCSICMDSYDKNLRPRNLPCGHTICTTCINNTIKEEIIECPHCKVPHCALNGSDFPVSFIAEAMISKFREAKLGTALEDYTESALSATEIRDQKRKTYRFINELQESLRSVTEAAKTTRMESEKYRAFIAKKVAQHRDLITEITSVLQRNKDIVKELEGKELKLMKYLLEQEIYQADISNAISKLENTTKSSDKFSVCEELVTLLDALGGWVLRGGVMKCVPAHIGGLPGIFAPTCSFLKANLCCAVQERDGCVYAANIKSKNGRTYLHHLKDSEPSDGVVLLQYHELILSLDMDNVVAFMDLAYDGYTQGRIHISLSPQTPLATQFWKLCTGEMGPCYVNTRFLQVLNKGHDDERVVAGDYEKGDGSGGAPLFTGLENRSTVLYSRSSEVGSIGAVEDQNDGPRSAQFVICTRTPTHSRNILFGRIQDGLDLVKTVIEHDDIRQAQIEDCGIVLPF